MTTPAQQTVSLGGASFTIRSAAGTPSYQSVSIPKEARHERSDYELAKHEKYCVEAGQLKNGEILELMEKSDHTSLDDVYDSTQIIEQIKTHLKNYDMLTTFHIFDVSRDTKGIIQSTPPTTFKDLFEDYGQITDSQITDNVEYMMTWVHEERVPAVYDSSGNVSTPAVPGAPWVLSDMVWSGKYLKNQMSSDLSKAIKDDLKDKGVDEKYHDLGPVLFKGFVDRMMNSNYSALELLKAELNRDNLSLDLFDGNIEEMAKKLTTIIERLQKCEIRNQSGQIQGLQHVPSNLSESLLLVLKTTGHESFDEIMKGKYAKGKENASKGLKDPFEPPITILADARKLYVSFKIAHEWDDAPGGNKNPSAFIAGGGTQTKSQCFGCGKVGCRQTERTCSRFGKSATPAGVQAKAAFDAEKQKRKEGKKGKGNGGGGGKNKWPPAPGKNDPKRKKLESGWHYWHYKTKKWLTAADQTDEGNQKVIEAAKAKKDSNSNKSKDAEPVNGLPAGLAAMVAGKEETSEVRLKREVYLQGLKKLEENFKVGLS